MSELKRPANHEQRPEEVLEESKAEPAVTKMSSLQIGLLMLALCTSTFLAALDITIVTTALPTISEHFHSSSAYIWVGAAYMLADGASTPVWGKVSDIWGRKPVLLLAVVIFFIGSAISASAVNMDMLIAGRAVQGLGGGGLLTLSNIVISDLFSMRYRGSFSLMYDSRLMQGTGIVPNTLASSAWCGR